jgi:hypothetical protein
MSLQSVQMLLSLALGFAVAGLCSSGYRAVTDRLPSLSLLQGGPRPSAFAALALLILAAPFLIVRNVVLGHGGEALDRFQFAFLGTLVAGFWSLMCGMALIAAARALLVV